MTRDPDRTRTIQRSEASRADRAADGVALAAPRRGDRIGRYIVEELIGTGGMGVVVAAADPELERQVALKLVRREIGDRAYRQRLVREARAMARLEHDNVVRVYDAGEHAGEVFVAMELIRGETVGAWLRGGPRSWRAVLDRFVAAGRGLAAAHRAGMVHRDFKPDNVLVRASDGRVCVTDFGLAVPVTRGETDAALPAVARSSHDPAATPPPTTQTAGGASDAGIAMDSTIDDGAPTEASSGRDPIALGTGRSGQPEVTRPGMIVGTPPYMAPEQHRGGEVDARADVFGFCVALYEGLYGERPFAVEPGAGRLGWARAIERGRVRPAPRGHGVPAALRRALLRGLAPDPAARWQTMDALLAALVARRGRRLPRAIAAIAGLVALATAAWIAVRWWRDRPLALPAGYADGLARLRKDDFRGAAQAFERAVGERAAFAPAWIGLAQARNGEPDLARAKAAAAKATQLVPPSDRALRLQAEGVAALIDEQLDTAIDRYKAYARFFPDDVDAGIALATAQAYGGHLDDALQTLAGLAAADDARVPLTESMVTMLKADWPRSNAAAARAIALGEARDAPQIVARGLLRRGLALGKLGNQRDAIADLETASAVIQRLGDRGLASRRLTMLTQLFSDTGDFASAARAADQAIAIDREVGEPNNLATDLLNAASARSELSELDRAGELYVEAFQLLRKVDNQMLLGHALLDYGQLQNDLGKRREADKALREAITSARAANDDQLILMCLSALAWNNLGLGLLDQAKAEWHEAATLAERTGASAAVAVAYENLGMVQAAQGDYTGAERWAAQALQLAERLDPTTLGRERAWNAVHLCDAGQYARAIELALPAATVLHDQHSARDEMVAHAAAALALAQAGRRSDAVAQLALGRTLLAQPATVDYRIIAADLLMRAAARLGARDEARAIYDAAPRALAGLPWAAQLDAHARRLGVTR